MSSMCLTKPEGEEMWLEGPEAAEHRVRAVLEMPSFLEFGRERVHAPFSWAGREGSWLVAFLERVLSHALSARNEVASASKVRTYWDVAVEASTASREPG